MEMLGNVELKHRPNAQIPVEVGWRSSPAAASSSLLFLSSPRWWWRSSWLLFWMHLSSAWTTLGRTKIQKVRTGDWLTYSVVSYVCRREWAWPAKTRLFFFFYPDFLSHYYAFVWYIYLAFLLCPSTPQKVCVYASAWIYISVSVCPHMLIHVHFNYLSHFNKIIWR